MITIAIEATRPAPYSVALTSQAFRVLVFYLILVTLYSHPHLTGEETEAQMTHPRSHS